MKGWSLRVGTPCGEKWIWKKRDRESSVKWSWEMPGAVVCVIALCEKNAVARSTTIHPIWVPIEHEPRTCVTWGWLRYNIATDVSQAASAQEAVAGKNGGYVTSDSSVFKAGSNLAHWPWSFPVLSLVIVNLCSSFWTNEEMRQQL